jgi:hypothetical protein
VSFLIDFLSFLFDVCVACSMCCEYVFFGRCATVVAIVQTVRSRRMSYLIVCRLVLRMTFWIRWRRVAAAGCDARCLSPVQYWIFPMTVKSIRNSAFPVWRWVCAKRQLFRQLVQPVVFFHIYFAPAFVDCSRQLLIFYEYSPVGPPWSWSVGRVTWL